MCQTVARAPRPCASRASLTRPGRIGLESEVFVLIVGDELAEAGKISKAKQIHQVITAGILDKGMPSWRPVLGASKVQDATAFVLSLKGKDVPGKAAQGMSEDGRPAP